MKSCQSKIINVLVLMNFQNQLYYQIQVGIIDSKIVIKLLDKFSQYLSISTVVFMDETPVNTTDKMIEKLEEWKHKKLEKFWLPTYSQKEKLIEIFWKFIKYEWIEFNAYESWSSLKKYLKKC